MEIFSDSSQGGTTLDDKVTAKIEAVESNDVYGKFVAEPLERGFGITLGNALRRVLLSSLTGTAITWVRIDGIQHEYSCMPHVKEDVTEFLLNVKGIRLRSLTDNPGKLILDVRGEGLICAGDITSSGDIDVVNPELHIATLDSEKASLSVEFNVERGKGYEPASSSNGLPIGVLPVDAIYTPVHKVNYIVEHTRVGQVTDYDRLNLEVWTDGSITPLEAVRQAAQILVDHFFLFCNLGKIRETEPEKQPLVSSIPTEYYNTPITSLGLSARTLNCLKRSDINKVGEVLETSKEDLLALRNFGEKSLRELYDSLRNMGIEIESEKKDEEGQQEGPEIEEEIISLERLDLPQQDSSSQEKIEGDETVR